MKRLTWSLLITLAILAGSASVAHACPMCKDTISDSATTQPAGAGYGSGGPQASLPSGFNFSIYYMLGGLFATIGLVACVITKAIRDSNAAMHLAGFPPVAKSR